MERQKKRRQLDRSVSSYFSRSPQAASRETTMRACMCQSTWQICSRGSVAWRKYTRSINVVQLCEYHVGYVLVFAFLCVVSLATLRMSATKKENTTHSLIKRTSIWKAVLVANEKVTREARPSRWCWTRVSLFGMAQRTFQETKRMAQLGGPTHSASGGAGESCFKRIRASSHSSGA